MAQKFNPLSGNFDLVLNKAREIQYLNMTSGLTATELQAAVDELAQMIADLPNPLRYVGTWDASTNTPTLSNADTGKEGYLYQVQVAGTVDFGAGPIDFAVGDKVVNNGTTWDKWDLTDAVLSVNGDTGIVSLTTADIPENTNLYFTDERAQDATGAMVASSAKVSLTYNDTTPSLTADIVAGSLVDADISASAAIAGSKLANASIDLTTKVTGILPVANGGTNSSTALNNNRILQSSSGSIVEAAAITANKALVSNSNGIPVASTTTDTELGYVSGVTSSIQTQLNSKASVGPGDIPETSFTAPTSATPADVTGALFSNAAVRSFVLTINAVGASTYETFTIRGIQRAADWIITQESDGDDSQVVFTITTSGQIQYESLQNLTLKFKASTVGV